jgi:hypothetical protein
VRFVDWSGAVGGLAEDECGRPDYGAGGDPERHRGDQSAERCGDENAGGDGRTGERERGAGEGKRDNGDGEDSSDAGDDQQRPRESPLSMLKALKSPAKSN